MTSARYCWLARGTRRSDAKSRDDRAEKSSDNREEKGRGEGRSGAGEPGRRPTHMHTRTCAKPVI